MTFITTGLTGGGVTKHYQFQYDQTLQKTSVNPSGPEPARTNSVIQSCENDYQLVSGWFNNTNVTGITVQVTTQGGGASWSGSASSSTMILKPAGSGFVNSADYLRYLIISEVSEIFMLDQNTGWFDPAGNEGSKGEGLSRFLSAQFLFSRGLNAGIAFAVAHFWLNSDRQDFVNNNPDDNEPDAVTGCSTLFIYFLFSQLGFSINAIVGSGAATLAGVYSKLTSNKQDPFPGFKKLIDFAFPSTVNSAISGSNPDNPFPISLPVNRDISYITDLLLST